MKTISIPTNDRPDYLRKVLDSIRAQEESHDYVLVFSCEPNAEVIRLIEEIDWTEVRTSKNRVKRGPDMNTFLAVDTAFGIGSEFNVYLEDDFVLSPDALKLADAFFSGPSKEDLMLAFRRCNQSQSEPNVVRTVGLSEGLINTGFCCRSWALPFLRRSWFRFQDSPPGKRGWDWAVGKWVFEEKQTVWRPMVNRSQHIGVIGTNCTDQLYACSNFSGPCFQERVESFEFIGS